MDGQRDLVPETEITREQEQGVTIVAVDGEIDISSSDRLEAELEALVSHEDLVIDLCRCEFIDSTGLRALVLCERRLRESGGRIAVAAKPGGAVARLIELTGVGRLKVHEDRVQALATLA